MSLGAEKSIADRDMADVNKLSTAIKELASMPVTPEKMSKLNLKSLNDKYSDVDWIRLVDNFVLKSNATPSITENTMIKLYEEIFGKLMALLKSTKPRAVANLVAMDVLANGIHAILPNEASLLNFTSFPTEEISRYQQYFGKFVASLNVQNLFDNKIRKKVQGLVDLSIKEMKQLLYEVKWMDNVTKRKARKKADKMTSLVGYDDEILDPTKMNAAYDPILEKMNSKALSIIRYLIIKIFH